MRVGCSDTVQRDESDPARRFGGDSRVARPTGARGKTMRGPSVATNSAV
jgi:hypothetical protein